MSSQDFYHGPDFVVLGVPFKDGQVMVIGSDNLSLAELRIAYEHDYAGDRVGRINTFPGTQSCELSTTMRTYQFVIAATYQEALRQLLESWQPKGRAGATPAVDAQRSLPAPTLELGGGR